MSDPYASHLPVLKALTKLVPMRRVLEFGAGVHSTPFFLSLPQLEALWSVETDASWRERVITDDARHTVSPETPLLGDFDFIFIDDGQNAADREHTIRNVLASSHPVTAIHDAEVSEYRTAIRDLAEDNALICCLDTPHTAVVWSGENRSRELLDAMEATE